MKPIIPGFYAIAGTFQTWVPGLAPGEKVACAFGGFFTVNEEMKIKGLIADPFGQSQITGEVFDDGKHVAFVKHYTLTQEDMGIDEKGIAYSINLDTRFLGSYSGFWTEVSHTSNAGKVMCSIDRNPDPTNEEQMMTSR